MINNITLVNNNVLFFETNFIGAVWYFLLKISIIMKSELSYYCFYKKKKIATKSHFLFEWRQYMKNVVHT